ncbi:hypothetical protein CEXT_133421 [Caerostris extrusa]|uniref:Uncharacterized protein n=1 Tax=Caerostris extrusa TaxID=172846 RepID=A0AAV4PYL6_CAEEX|nr:hypothetical protein CEXT_133421 [Caerostris extrusa]
MSLNVHRFNEEGLLVREIWLDCELEQIVVKRVWQGLHPEGPPDGAHVCPLWRPPLQLRHMLQGIRRQEKSLVPHAQPLKRNHTGFTRAYWVNRRI